MSAAREGLTERILSVSSPFRRTIKRLIPFGMTRSILCRAGLEPYKCECPVDIRSIPARRNRHHSVTSPFRRTIKSTQNRKILGAFLYFYELF